MTKQVMMPGPELNKEIGTKVMGWKILNHWDADGTVKHLLDENGCEVIPAVFKPYSQDIVAAMEVFEKIKTDHSYIIWTELFGWTVQIGVRGGAYAAALPHAICLAALEIQKR